MVLRVNLSINYWFGWLRCISVSSLKCNNVSPWWGMLMIEKGMHVWGMLIMRVYKKSIPSSQFCYEPKPALKKGYFKIEEKVTKINKCPRLQGWCYDIGRNRLPWWLKGWLLHSTLASPLQTLSTFFPGKNPLKLWSRTLDGSCFHSWPALGLWESHSTF